MGSDGRHALRGEVLAPLEATWGPVRSASATPPTENLQLDIYGELLDSVYLYDKYARPFGYDGLDEHPSVDRLGLRELAAPDEGIWEVRGGRRSSSTRGCCAGGIDRADPVATKRLVPAR